MHAERESAVEGLDHGVAGFEERIALARIRLPLDRLAEEVVRLAELRIHVVAVGDVRTLVHVRVGVEDEVALPAHGLRV
jgi:hypothetical protein